MLYATRFFCEPRRLYRRLVYLSQAALPDRLEVLLFVYLDFFRAVVVVN